jgi:uncharacterized protein involved in exopolysaccharide biosynthesis
MTTQQKVSDASFQEPITQNPDPISYNQDPRTNNQVPYYPPHMMQPMPADDEIDLRELFIALWKGKWLIIFITTLFAAGGVYYALKQPNTYKAQVLLAPTQGSGSMSLGGSLGGLASLAGVNLGGDSADPKVEALAILNSRKFIEAFIQKHQLLVPLMASKEWNALSNVHTLNNELYDSNSQQWLTDAETGESLMPTMWEAHKAFKALFSVSEAKDSGMVTLSITHHSAVLAQEWVSQLVLELNEWMKTQTLQDTANKINYLEAQIVKTQVTELQNMFYSLIEEQYKQQMLAEVEEEFVFKTIDPAVVPEEKDGPKRALICVLATLLGGMLGVTIVLIRFGFKKEK